MSQPALCPLCGVAMQLPAAAPGHSFACPRCGAMLVTAAGGTLVASGQAAAPLGPGPVNPFAEVPEGLAHPGGYGAGGFAPGPFAPRYLPMPMTREMALAKVQGPGVLLQVMGVVVALAGLALLTLLIPEHRRDSALVVLVGVAAPLAMAIGALALYCGGLLKALRSYALVMTSVVLILAAGFLLCPLGALPAIWPLIVLLDPGVKRHFQSPPPDESAYRSGKIM